MAYKCTKYNKILVGPKKLCDRCEESNLEKNCQFRVWQDGVLKEGGKRTRGKWVFPKNLIPMYKLGEDGRYYYCGSPKKKEKTIILDVLTQEEMELIKNPKFGYYKLLIQKGIVDDREFVLTG